MKPRPDLLDTNSPTNLEAMQLTDEAIPSAHVYMEAPLFTFDGKRLVISCFLATGASEESTWGLMVFDIAAATVNLILHGPSWCNVHPQYCRSTDPKESHDILVQENHGNIFDPITGKVSQIVTEPGIDIHVVRDDGGNFRTLPWGRDGNEHCQGHQCWRGRSTWAITSAFTLQPRECQLIEGRAIPDAGHLGKGTPGAVRNDLTLDYPAPDFYHFAADIQGNAFITDSGPRDGGGGLHYGKLSTPGESPIVDMTYILNPRCSWQKESHIHPFLSPDGTMGFFNSDESGILQAYMVRGLG